MERALTTKKNPNSLNYALRFQITPQAMVYTFAGKDPKIDLTTDDNLQPVHLHYTASTKRCVALAQTDAALTKVAGYATS